MICFVMRQTSLKMIYPVTRIPQQIAILTQILTLELAQTILLIDGNDKQATINSLLKDGDYYCYCAYVLHISRYSDFLSPVLTNTGIFLRGLKLSGESRS